MVGPSPCCDRQTQEKQTATHDCPRRCKEKKKSHGKQSLNAMCNHVEQPGTPTATQQLTCDGRQRPDKHTSHTLSQSNAQPHLHNATCDTEIENNMRAYNKTRNTWHTLEPERRSHHVISTSIFETRPLSFFDQRWLFPNGMTKQPEHRENKTDQRPTATCFSPRA